MKIDPISLEFRSNMNDLAAFLDDMLNGDRRPKRIGFALLTYNFNEVIEGTGRVNYIGNGERNDVLTALKELVARWEGRYNEPDKVQ